MTVYLKVGRSPLEETGAPFEEPPERVERATFVGEGCTISQAAASMLMERVREERPSLDDVLAMGHEDMVDLLGQEAVSMRPRCATLALGTLKAAVRKYRDDERRRAAGLPMEELPTLEVEPGEG